MLAPLSLSAGSFTGKSILCSTERFPVKGGFEFISHDRVIRYNILFNKKNINKKLDQDIYCYMKIDNEIAFSKLSGSKCKNFDSFLDINSLIYKIPMKDHSLEATCKYYDYDLRSLLLKTIHNDHL